MATLLERAQMPGSGVGLTAGVNYFGDVGQRQSVSLLRPPDNVSPAAPTLIEAEAQAPDTGWRVNPPEPGFARFGSYGGAGEGRTGQGAPAGPMSSSDAATLGLMGAGLGTLATATQDPGLGTMGNVMSGAAAASQGQYGPIGATVGGLLGGPTGAALGSIGGQMASQGGPTASGIAGTLGGAMFGAPGYALGSIGGQVASGTATPSSIGSTLGYAALGPMLGPAAGPVGAMIGGGLFGFDSTMSPMGVPNPGYAGLFGTNLGTRLGPEAFANPSTPSGIGTSGGIGFGMGSYGLGAVGQTNVGASMGGAGGITTGSSGLGLSAASPGASSIGSSIGSSSGGRSSSSVGSLSGSSFSGGRAGGGGSRSTGIGGGSLGGGLSSGGGTGLRAGGGTGLSRSSWADGGLIDQSVAGTMQYMSGGAVSSPPMLSLGYADGGMMGNKPNPGIVNRRIDAFLRNPEARESLLARPRALLESGELTLEEVQTMGRVAEAALYSPSLYPQLRRFVVEQGMAPLPAAYDQNTVLRIVAISRALQTETPAGEIPPLDQASMTPPEGFARGGYLSGPGTGRSDSIGTINESNGQPVRVANGEYVIPAHVVRAKGQEFFDSLLRRYANEPKGEA